MMTTPAIDDIISIRGFHVLLSLHLITKVIDSCSPNSMTDPLTDHQEHQIPWCLSGSELQLVTQHQLQQQARRAVAEENRSET